MNKRKLLIAILIIISLLLVGIIGFIGVKVANENKINNYMKLGIMYLEEDKFDEAKGAFSKVISIDGKQEEAYELLALTDDYMKLEELYDNKDYLLVSDLISKIDENKYLSYIKDKVDEISSNTESKIAIINEINNLDSRIEGLLKENKFKEANELINRYLGEDLKEEYLDKLSGLINKVNDYRKAYEEEQAKLEEIRQAKLEEERLAEEKRIAEEKRLAEEERKVQEENDRISYSQRRIKEVLGIDVIYDGFGAYDYIAESIIFELDKLGFANAYKFSYAAHDIVLYDIATDRIAYLSQRGSILISNNRFTDIEGINHVFDIYEKHTDEELKSWFGI